MALDERLERLGLPDDPIDVDAAWAGVQGLAARRVRNRRLGIAAAMAVTAVVVVAGFGLWNAADDEAEVVAGPGGVGSAGVDVTPLSDDELWQSNERTATDSVADFVDRVLQVEGARVEGSPQMDGPTWVKVFLPGQTTAFEILASPKEGGWRIEQVGTRATVMLGEVEPGVVVLQMTPPAGGASARVLVSSARGTTEYVVEASVGGPAVVQVEDPERVRAVAVTWSSPDGDVVAIAGHRF